MHANKVRLSCDCMALGHRRLYGAVWTLGGRCVGDMYANKVRWVIDGLDAAVWRCTGAVWTLHAAKCEYVCEYVCE